MPNDLTINTGTFSVTIQEGGDNSTLVYNKSVGIFATLMRWYDAKIMQAATDTQADTKKLTDATAVLSTWTKYGPLDANSTDQFAQVLQAAGHDVYDHAAVLTSSNGIVVFTWPPGKLTDPEPTSTGLYLGGPPANALWAYQSAGAIANKQVVGVMKDGVPQFSDPLSERTVKVPDQATRNQWLGLLQADCEALAQTSGTRSAYVQDLIAQQSKWYEALNGGSNRRETNMHELARNLAG